MSNSLIHSDLKSHAFLMAALDEKQKLYVESRALGSMPVAAARVAGYADPDRAGTSLEADTTVRMAVEVATRLKSREHKITRDTVLQWLQDAYLAASTSTEMVGAAREIAKLLGLYEPQTINVNKTLTLRQEQITQLSDRDLAELAGGAIDGEFEVLEFEAEPVAKSR